MSRKLTIVIAFAGLVGAAEARGQAPAERYPIDSASVEHAGVPKGELIHCRWDHSAIFPGTQREYWIYVPAQYRPERPACVYVNQDGIQWKAPTVFDNLIAVGEMPVTIGIFIQPGRVVATDGATASGQAGAGSGATAVDRSASGSGATATGQRLAGPETTAAGGEATARGSGDGSASLDRFNRSFEYDGLGDAYARFLLEEILPDVEKHRTGDGRAIRLSHSGNDRAIGGSSSGAVCAFTVAWERPNEFTRVFSAIGTYVGLRGADRYPTLIRKYEPKPIRIFLQDGSHDLNIYGGDWWMANQMMERALEFGGYAVDHVWGEGAHSGTQGTALFPEAMRWLWKGWPQPVAKGNSTNQTLKDILIPGQEWELVGEKYGFTEGTAADAQGNVFYQDIPASITYKVGADGKPVLFSKDAKRASGTCFATDGSRYEVAGATKQIIKYDAGGRPTVIADNINGNDLLVTRNGNVYVTVPDGSEKPSKLILIRPGGEKLVVDSGLKFINGLTLTPDQSQLYVAESNSHWVWIYTIKPDGTLANKQRFGWLHSPDNSETAWPDGMKCDTAGRLYVATRLGIQVLDPLGRVNAMIPVPSGQSSNCCFGGPAFDILYVSSGDKVYRRKLNVRGCNPFERPIKPGSPHL